MPVGFSPNSLLAPKGLETPLFFPVRLGGAAMYPRAGCSSGGQLGLPWSLLLHLGKSLSS